MTIKLTLIIMKMNYKKNLTLKIAFKLIHEDLKLEEAILLKKKLN